MRSKQRSPLEEIWARIQDRRSSGKLHDTMHEHLLVDVVGMTRVSERTIRGSPNPLQALYHLLPLVMRPSFGSYEEVPDEVEGDQACDG